MQQTLSNLQVSYTYHQHTGSAGATANGCYTKANYHSHTGNSSQGGGCYTNAVKHSHTGSASGGGCYTKPVYHAHVSGCYRTCGGKYSSWSSEEYGETWYHLTCGGCGYQYTVGSSMEAYNQGKTPCTRSIISCGKSTSYVDSYTLGCNKTTSTIDYYTATCGMDASTLLGYVLGCGKTEQTIESATIIY